ncbi:MAG: ATP-dependent Clp protease proteolytic subunit [Kiritimatiellales bacterium]|nr:ATP-dependent Clp protease proteolytic subunit [Kiritimatiellales bacterium]
MTTRKYLFCLLAGLLCCGVSPAPAEEAPAKVVYVIPIRKAIEPALLYVVRRGMDEAVREKADAIVFTMDTPGGRVDVTEDIIKLITETDIPIYTFVENQAFSAGAIIALATKHIYMAPGSVIGAATPLTMTPMGGVQELPDEVKEKMTSAVAALVRSAAEQGGHDKELAEAMVRADMEYEVNGKVISKEGRLLTLTNEEAEQLVGEDPHPLLSEGTVKDLDEMLEKTGLAGAEKRVLEVTGAERLARLIAGMASVLLLLGLGGIYMEFKTPGFGIFGITGITCLALFFFGHHIAGLAGMEDVLVFMLGVILLLIEILVIPGFGITGITGILLIFISLVSAMSERMPGEWRPISFAPETFAKPLLNVTVAFVGAFALAALAGKYLPKTHAFKSITLDATIQNPGDSSELLGLEGVARSDLRPGGTALFGDRRLDVVTHGNYINQGTAIQIVETHGNRIVVEEA